MERRRGGARFALGCVLSLMATQVGAIPCRPTGGDYSVALPNGSALEVSPAADDKHTVPSPMHIASNGERDCLDQGSLNAVVTAAATFRQQLAPLGGLISSVLTEVYTRLDVIMPYRGTLRKGATWPVPLQGRLYQTQQTTLWKIRAQLTLPKIAPQAALLATPDLMRLLYVDATFDPHSKSDVTYAPWPKWDSAAQQRGQSFMVDTRKPLPPCGNGDCSLLAATRAAHKCGTLVGHCNVPIDLLPLDVKTTLVEGKCPNTAAASLAYELACQGDERCETFRRMKPFTGGSTDPAIAGTPTECLIGLLEDNRWGVWQSGQQLGDWGLADLGDTGHAELHTAQRWYDPRVLYIFPDEALAAADLATSFGGKAPMQELLPKLVDRYHITIPTGATFKVADTTDPHAEH